MVSRPDGDAFLERGARLFEPKPVESVEEPGGDDRVLSPPATVRIADDRVFGTGHRVHRGDAVAVQLRSAAELQLEMVDAAGPFAFDEGRHRRRLAEWDRDVQRQPVLHGSAEEHRDRLVRRSPEDVPARDVQRALGVLVSAQRPVHDPADLGEIGRVDADQGRSQLAQRGPGALSEARKVGRPERTRLAEPLETAACPDPDHRARQDVHDPPGRHDVVAVGVGQVVPVDVHPVDDGRAVAQWALLKCRARWCTTGPSSV